MSLSGWNDNFALGLPEIDRDHKILFDLIAQLHDAHAAGKGPEELEIVFSLLLDYIDSHFEREEKLIAIHNYPEAEAHHAAHAWFSREVRAMFERFKAGGDEGLCVEIIAFLSNWWRFHVLEDDRLYSRHIARTV
jgi:hemerythrin-like metal-binding protein